MPDSKVEVKAVPVYVEEALCKWFSEAPCFLCGYNGEGYYQPNAHSCAKHYHSMTLSKLWNTRPIANNGVSLEDILNILVEEDYKSYLEMDKKLGSIQWTSKPDKETILAMSRERLTPSAIAIHAKLPTTAINNGVSFEDIEKIIWKHCTPLYEEDIQGHTHTLKGNELAKAIHAKLQPTAPDPKQGLSVKEILAALKYIPSTKIPISEINGKIFYYMCKEDIAQALQHCKCHSGQVVAMTVIRLDDGLFKCPRCQGIIVG